MDVTTLTTFLERSIDQLATVDQGLSVNVMYGDDFELEIGKKLEFAAKPYQIVTLTLPKCRECRCDERF